MKTVKLETRGILGGVRICFDNAAGRFTEETVEELELRGLVPHLRRAFAWRSLVCVECGGLFLGHFAAKACSVECAKLRHARQLAAKNQQRAKRSLAERSRYCTWCETCRKPMEAKRASKRFCSATCRQVEHRSKPATRRKQRQT